MGMRNQNIAIATIATILTIVATVFGITKSFVSKEQFEEFRLGTTDNLEKRMDTMDKKLDAILRLQTNHKGG